MTPQDFLVWLQEIATGWLGWKPNEFEFANMSDILVAYEGHLKKLKTIHGSGEEKTKQEITDAQAFAATFGNRGIKRN